MVKKVISLELLQNVVFQTYIELLTANDLSTLVEFNQSDLDSYNLSSFNGFDRNWGEGDAIDAATFFFNEFDDFSTAIGELVKNLK